MAAKQNELEVQLIANVVVCDRGGRVALTRYDPDDERWWLPGSELEPFEHPDEVAQRVVGEIGVSVAVSARLDHVESFRGRRGWHVMFNYVAEVADPGAISKGAEWFDSEALPRTFHGPWEAAVVRRALSIGAVGKSPRS